MKKKKIPAEPEFEPEIIDDQKDIELTQDIIELEQWKNIDCDITKKIINIRKKGWKKRLVREKATRSARKQIAVAAARAREPRIRKTKWKLR